MIYTEKTKKAMEIMYRQHANQFDKAGVPYVFHPWHVAESQTDETRTIVALLHDVIEDTNMSLEDLRKEGFSEEVLEALKLLSHDWSIDYFDYVKRLAENPIALDVKLADLKHNSDLTRLNEIKQEDLERKSRYDKCIEYLELKKKMNEKKETKKDDNYIEAAIEGFVLSDALGVPVEFSSKQQMKSHPLTDMIEFGTHHQPIGTWSDDSSMMLGTLVSLNEKHKIDYEDIMSRYSDWINNANYTATDVVFDYGGTTIRAVSNYDRGIRPSIECGDKGVNSNGNGSLMRTLPIALYLANSTYTEEEKTKIINDYSSMTHAHEISKLGCKIYSDYIEGLLKNDMDKNKALDYVKTIDYHKYYTDEAINEYKRIIDGSIKDAVEEDIRGSGYVVHTLEASIWAVMNSNGYKEAVLKAINLGEDTDTVGAVTGSLAGMVYGKEDIPEDWLNQVKKIDWIKEEINKFDSFIKNQNIYENDSKEELNDMLEKTSEKRSIFDNFFKR